MARSKCPYCGTVTDRHDCCSKSEEVHEAAETRKAGEKKRREREDNKSGGYTLGSFLRDIFS
ncbi:MAG: hypothetical protein V1656_01920 [Candidatus Jorgensenbacteria bacterium]